MKAIRMSEVAALLQDEALMEKARRIASDAFERQGCEPAKGLASFTHGVDVFFFAPDPGDVWNNGPTEEQMRVLMGVMNAEHIEP